MSIQELALRREVVLDYIQLTKPRITLLVMVTTFVGFVMAAHAPVSSGGLLATLLGTGMVAAGASALNMLLERRTDALMKRTATRPLPAGRLRPPQALVFGMTVTLLGLGVLLWRSGLLAGLVAGVTWAVYVLIYTPLKTRTSLATLVGAFPGALPPVIGWTAARGDLEPGAIVLLAILYLWQIPHFLAIAWIYREDYARGGLPMLPVLDPEGRLTGRQAVANALALLLVSLAPTAAGMTGRVYLWGAAVLGLGFTAAAIRAAVVRTPLAARHLFLVSLLYLSALCTLLVLDRV